MQHNKITGADVHVLHAFTYADVTARTGATGFTAEDVGKAALQQSDTTLWGLTNHSPITWVQIGTGAPPGPHTHAESDVTGLVADLANKSDVGHTHAEADITGLTADLASKADVGHVHDDRYYTETETDALLTGKAAATHTHAEGDITGLTADLAAKAPLNSPALTGTPTAPTAAAGTNSTQIATTAFVTAAVAAGGGGSGGGSATPTAAVRETVLSGRVDTGGFANFIEAGSGLAAVVKGAAVAAVITFANGFDTTGAPVDYFGRITTDSTVSGLTASATNYLYADYTAGTVSLGASVLVPLYSGVDPSSSSPALIPAMTSNTTPSGTASAGSILSANYPAYHAFDQTSTGSYPCWISGSTTADWVAYAFSSGQTFKSYSVQVPTAAGLGTYDVAAPKNWTFEGSNDGVTWTVLDTRTNQTGWTSGESRTFNLTAPVTYSRIRLNVSAVNGGSYIAVDQLQVYGGVVTDQHWFDLSTMTMKRWNGSAWESKNRVFLGEAVTNGSGVTSVTTYALRGQYLPDTYSVAASTNITKNHNIGTDKILVQALVATSAGGAQAVVLPSSVSRNSVIYNSGAGAVESRVVARRAF